MNDLKQSARRLALCAAVLGATVAAATATTAMGGAEYGYGFIVIDEDSIDNGNPPNFFSARAVNDDIAEIGRRNPLPAFSGSKVGSVITLHTGEVGDEGWFAPKKIPSSWNRAGPTSNGLRNFLGDNRRSFPHDVGPGLGTKNSNGDREALLDKIPRVTPLRATGLRMLVGKYLCAVVWDSDISMNYGPLNGSLKGANLGTVAFKVLSVSPLFGFSSGSLPKVKVQILDPKKACNGSLFLFTGVPEPVSSSEPYDTGR